jgi:plastocyanin
MTPPARVSILFAFAGLLAACRGGSAPSDAGTPGDAVLHDASAEATADIGGPVDAMDATHADVDASVTDASTDTSDAPAEAAIDPNFIAIAPCATPAAYVRTPLVVNTLVSSYDPPCLRLPAGSRVQIEASTVHPLEPRPGGSPANPITAQIATTTFTFPAPGFYPFLCPEHVDQGMLGVVWVTSD